VIYLSENVLLGSEEDILAAIAPLKPYKRNIVLLQKVALTNTICMELQIRLTLSEKVRVLFVTNESDAVRILLKLASMQLHSNILTLTKQKKPRDIEADITGTVRQLPNVSKIKSWALLQNFKSIAAISTATREEIEECFTNSEDSKKATETAKEITSFFANELKV